MCVSRVQILLGLLYEYMIVYVRMKVWLNVNVCDESFIVRWSVSESISKNQECNKPNSLYLWVDQTDRSYETTVTNANNYSCVCVRVHVCTCVCSRETVNLVIIWIQLMGIELCIEQLIVYLNSVLAETYLLMSRTSYQSTNKTTNM